MNRYWKAAAGAGLGVAIVLAVSGGAVAAPITGWDYTLNSAFFEFDERWTAGSGPNPALGGFTRVELPAAFDGPRSALEVAHGSLGVVSGSVATNGGSAAGPDLVHINNPVPTDPEEVFVLNGRLTVLATLTPTDPEATEAVGPFETSFDFVYKETRNVGPCGYESASTCDDIFLLTDSGDTARSFEYMGEAYELIFGSEELGVLSNRQCAEVGAAPGCIGFLTHENGTTTFGTFISVVGADGATPVNEPETLALLGAGLVVLGLAGRRAGRHRGPRTHR